MVLRARLHHLGDRIRGLPHAIRGAWPLNRIPRSRDWELLIIAYLVAMSIALLIFFLFSQKSFAP
jgi:hypothetical protein